MQGKSVYRYGLSRQRICRPQCADFVGWWVCGAPPSLAAFRPKTEPTANTKFIKRAIPKLFFLRCISNCFVSIHSRLTHIFAFWQLLCHLRTFSCLVLLLQAGTELHDTYHKVHRLSAHSLPNSIIAMGKFKHTSRTELMLI